MLASSHSSSFSLPDELAQVGQWTNSLAEIGLTPREIERKLNNFDDQLQQHRQTVLKNNFILLKGLVASFLELDENLKLKLLSTLISALSLKIQIAEGEFCEYYECLSLLLIVLIEKAEKYSITLGTNKKKNQGGFDWSHLRLPLVDNVCKFLSKQDLNSLYSSKSRLETLVGSLLKMIHHLVESTENLKIVLLRTAIIECFAWGVAKYRTEFVVKTMILQDLNYFTHLAEFWADTLGRVTSSDFWENDVLIAELFKSIGEHRFSNQDANASKTIGVFLTRMASIAPKETLRHITLVIDQIDCEAYPLRMAFIDVLACLIRHLTQQERTDQTKAQIKSFFAAIEERIRDVNSFVRARVLNVLGDLCGSDTVPVAKRLALVEIAVDRVMDKGSGVRKRAIQLLVDLIKTHPFCIEGGELSLSHFTQRLEDVDKLLAEFNPGEDLVPSVESIQVEISTVLLQKRYYTDAINFVQQIDKVVPTLCRLLSSTTKTEVFEVIDFFVEAHAYRIESVYLGVKKMMHLVWERDFSSEDGTKKSIKEHVLEAYRRIYLEVDERLSSKDRVLVQAQNLLMMVEGATIAEMASLEQMIMEMMDNKTWISESVVQTIYLVLIAKTTSPRLARSALILLTMMATKRFDILLSRIDSILKHGLGPLGQKDVVVAEYCCKALRVLSGGNGEQRLANDNIVILKLVDFIHLYCVSPAWFQVITTAVRTIYLLADCPDVVMSKLLREIAQEILGLERGSSFVLAKLLHLTGAIALGQSEHLDAIEEHWKKVNSKEVEAKKGKSKSKAEFDQITSTTGEDEFSDLIRQVRDSEMLMGVDSLLQVLGCIISHVCFNNVQFGNRLLQNTASIALGKLMTVSPFYLERNLSLFLTILEQSKDSTIRANMVIVFGDLIHSFGRLIDQNVVFLFARLRDEDVGVRRNALLVLTHLTLTGMIKVKGHLGLIAMCLLDKEGQMSDLARLFFNEVASKDSAAIYNHIPDIVSTTTSQAEELMMISEDDFQTMMRFIFDFIKKEKQMEGLVEKLCQRLRMATNQRQARDVAYCLSLVNVGSEKCIRKLLDAFPLYQDKLADTIVYRHFTELVSKTKKLTAKPTTGGVMGGEKRLLEEFEQKMIKAAGETVDEVVEDIRRMSIDALPKPRKQGARRKNTVDDDDDEPKGIFKNPSNSMDIDSNNEDVFTAAVAKRTSGRKGKTRPAVMKVESGPEDI